MTNDIRGRLNSCSAGLCHLALVRLHSLTVAAVGGVDSDLLALVDEERNHDLGTGLESHFLEGAGRSGVALDSRLCIGNLEGYVGRKLAGEALLLRLDNEHHLNMLSFLHEV